MSTIPFFIYYKRVGTNYFLKNGIIFWNELFFILKYIEERNRFVLKLMLTTLQVSSDYSYNLLTTCKSIIHTIITRGPSRKSRRCKGCVVAMRQHILTPQFVYIIIITIKL